MPTHINHTPTVGMATHKMPFRHVACAWLSGIYDLTKPHWGRVESYVGGNQRFFSSKSTTNEKSAVAIHACIVSAFNHKVVNLDKIKIKFVNFINYYYFCMSKIKFYGGMREN